MVILLFTFIWLADIVDISDWSRPCIAIWAGYEHGSIQMWQSQYRRAILWLVIEENIFNAQKWASDSCLSSFMAISHRSLTPKAGIMLVCLFEQKYISHISNHSVKNVMHLFYSKKFFTGCFILSWLRNRARTNHLTHPYYTHPKVVNLLRKVRFRNPHSDQSFLRRYEECAVGCQTKK